MRYSKQSPINLRNYGLNSDAYIAVIQNYINGIKSSMILSLQKNKKMSEDKAFDFVEHLFNMGYDRTRKMINKIKDYYQEGQTVSNTAKKLLDTYYKIAVINSENPIYSTPEVVEVTESVDTVNNKVTSKRLFWIFLNKLNEINVKFDFNTYYIKGIDNSLNKDKYFINMISNKIDTQDVIYEFKYSKLLSSFLKFIKTKPDVAFFLNINNQNILQFGYIINTKKYELGYYKYTNFDIAKMDFILDKTNNAINFRELSSGFRTNLAIAHQVKKTLLAYLNKYEDIDYYITISNNKFIIVIDCRNSDVLNKKYLERIINNHLSTLEYKRISIIDNKIDKRYMYYISIF